MNEIGSSEDLTPLRMLTPGPERPPSEQRSRDVWRSEPQIALLIDNVPANWMVGKLKSFLDKFGSVVKIEIFEDSQVSSQDFQVSLTLDWQKQRSRKSHLQVSNLNAASSSQTYP